MALIADKRHVEKERLRRAFAESGLGNRIRSGGAVLFSIIGPPLEGKYELAQKLADAVPGATLIGYRDDFAGATFRDREDTEADDDLLDILLTNVRSRLVDAELVVLCTRASTPKLRKRIWDVAQTAEASLLFVEVNDTEDAVIDRITGEIPPSTDGLPRLTRYVAESSRYEPLTAEEEGYLPAIKVGGSQPAGEQFAAIAAALSVKDEKKKKEEAAE